MRFLIVLYLLFVRKLRSHNFLVIKLSPIKLIFNLLVVGIFYKISLHSYFDLETLAQEFVQDTRQIILLNHPYAFNPSIVRWRGALLMSFREMVESDFESKSEIYSSGNS